MNRRSPPPPTELERRAGYLEALRVAATAANRSSTSSPDALATALESICGSLGCTGGRVLLRDQVADEMATGRDTGMIGRVLATGLPEQIIDVRLLPAGDPDRLRCTRGEAENVRAVAAVPILIADEVCGVLEFLSDTPFAADVALLDVMAQVGLLLGRAVERERGAAALRDARQDADDASTAESDFLSRLSHEFRTPLAAILGYTELLGLAPLQEEERRYLTAIEDGGARLLEVVNDVLDVARDRAAARERRAMAAAPGHAAARDTVLYVEDNIVNIEWMQSIFARLRPKVQLVCSGLGEPAVDLAIDHLPALILLDVNLPDIDGPEVIRRLGVNQSTRAIPVVMVSADAVPSTIERCLAAGAVGYVTKPVRLARVLEYVDRAIGDAAPEHASEIIGRPAAPGAGPLTGVGQGRSRGVAHHTGS